MAYNKDDLNGVKGRIGELIFQNFIYNKYMIDGIITIDIQNTIDEIMGAHQPIENCLLFLCYKCHKIYDNPSPELSQNS